MHTLSTTSQDTHRGDTTKSRKGGSLPTSEVILTLQYSADKK